MNLPTEAGWKATRGTLDRGRGAQLCYFTTFGNEELSGVHRLSVKRVIKWARQDGMHAAS
jgi:hypothetical protein